MPFQESVRGSEGGYHSYFVSLGVGFSCRGGVATMKDTVGLNVSLEPHFDDSTESSTAGLLQK